MLLVRSVVIVLLGLCTCFGQKVEDLYGNSKSVVSAKKNQDVAILKQIHRHNEDGSYTYGFEGADGSFKIETKTRSGEVSGKYGYVDDSGKLRVVEYGANRHGFQPSGEGITVPPPTLVQLRPDGSSDTGDGGDDAAAEAERPRPQQANRPSVAKAQRNERPASGNDAFAQQQQQRPTPAANVVDGEDSPAGWAARQDDQSSWSSRPQVPANAAARPRAPAPEYRPARFGASGGAVRAKPPAPRPAVGGSFEAVPSEGGPSGAYRPAQDFGPSGAYQSAQDFGPSGAYRSAQDFGGAAPRNPPTVSRSYETFEDQEEAVTEPPLYRTAAVRPASRPAARRDGGGGAPARQMRAGGVLDQLAAQYALPESRSPVSHSVSFGLDQ